MNAAIPTGARLEDRVTADDEFEGVERSGEWRPEGARYSASGPATDKDAQITTAQAKGLPKPRGETTCELRIARLKSNGRTDAA